MLVSAQLNNATGLRRGADVLGDAGVPVPVYGYVIDARRDRREKYGRLEVDRNGVRFAVISRIKNAKGQTKPVATRAGADALGNLGALEGLRFAAFDRFSVSVSVVHKLEIRQAAVYLELSDRKIKYRKLLVEPLHLCVTVASEGPRARQFANQYTAIVARHGGLETAKFGKES